MCWFLMYRKPRTYGLLNGVLGNETMSGWTGAASHLTFILGVRRRAGVRQRAVGKFGAAGPGVYVVSVHRDPPTAAGFRRRVFTRAASHPPPQVPCVPPCRFRQRRACSNPVIIGRLMNVSESCGGAQCYQDVLVLRVSGFVFGRGLLPCTGLSKDLADGEGDGL